VPNDAAKLWVAPYWRFYTGEDVPGGPRLWILNPGGLFRASVKIHWRSSEGKLMKEDSFDLGPGECVSRLPDDVASYVDTHGHVVDGYVQIVSDQPVIPWGTTYLDDHGTLTLSDTTVTPTFAPMVFYRYEEAVEESPWEIAEEHPGVILGSGGS
jgi:hypothetical protein